MLLLQHHSVPPQNWPATPLRNLGPSHGMSRKALSLLRCLALTLNSWVTSISSCAIQKQRTTCGSARPVGLSQAWDRNKVVPKDIKNRPNISNTWILRESALDTKLVIIPLRGGLLLQALLVMVTCKMLTLLRVSRYSRSAPQQSSALTQGTTECRNTEYQLKKNLRLISTKFHNIWN